MSERIKVSMFDKVSGDMRGVATAFFKIANKHEKRICHAYITTKGVDISLDIPKHIPANQIEDMLKLVSDFYKKVEML